MSIGYFEKRLEAYVSRLETSALGEGLGTIIMPVIKSDKKVLTADEAAELVKNYRFSDYPRAYSLLND